MASLIFRQYESPLPASCLQQGQEGDDEDHPHHQDDDDGDADFDDSDWGEELLYFSLKASAAVGALLPGVRLLRWDFITSYHSSAETNTKTLTT